MRPRTKWIISALVVVGLLLFVWAIVRVVFNNCCLVDTTEQALEQLRSESTYDEDIQTTNEDRMYFVSILNVFQESGQWYLQVEHPLVRKYTSDEVRGYVSWIADDENALGTSIRSEDILLVKTPEYFDQMAYTDDGQSLGDQPRPLTQLAEELKDQDELMRYGDDIQWPFGILLNERGEIEKLVRLYVE